MILFMKATTICNVSFSLWYFDNLESNFKFFLRNVVFSVTQTNTVKTDELFVCRKYGYTETIVNDRSVLTLLSLTKIAGFARFRQNGYHVAK